MGRFRPPHQRLADFIQLTREHEVIRTNARINTYISIYLKECEADYNGCETIAGLSFF